MRGIAIRGSRAAEIDAGDRLPRYDLGAPAVAAFSQRLRELGYTGRDIRIEYRWAEGKPERFAALAAELVALKVRKPMFQSGR